MIIRTDYKAVIEEIYEEIKQESEKGRLANYIPELANASLDKFGMCVHTVDNKKYVVGDCSEYFTIQSISKVFSLTLAMLLEGDDLWKRVGREPSGNAFNSLVQLEYENGIPRNPFINAGALVVTDVLVTNLIHPKPEILDFLQKLTNCPSISFNNKVAASEASVGYRNKAMAYFMKSFGNIRNDVETVLDNYFYHCAISMNCEELAAAGLFLANGGVSPLTGEIVTNKRQAKYINSLLLTCGTYDAVGSFAYRVGLPAKSGVGGGILAIMPEQFSASVWSPGLDKAGNPLLATLALDKFTTKTGISIF